MKNLLTVLSLVMVASPAFASRARLEALGEGKNGSYYINDDRNFFLNPAAISNFKKKLILEAGAEASTSADSLTSQKVQGGFINTFGDFTYGLYLGREADRAYTGVTTATAVTGQAFLTPDNAVEFYLGSETSGTKWGLGLYYQGNYDKSATVEKTQSTLAAKLGASMNNINAFATVGISNKHEVKGATAATTAELKGKISVDVGATYTMDDMTVFGKFTTFGSDITGGNLAAVNGSATGSTTAFGLGAGWNKEASKTVSIFSRVEVDYQKNTSSSTASGVTTDGNPTTAYYMPVVLGAEASATSWMKLRGSLSHALLGQSQTGAVKTDLSGETGVSAGIGFNFGDVNVDTLLGTSTAAAIGTSEFGSINSAVGANGQWGFGNTMFSRISMTYNF